MSPWDTKAQGWSHFWPSFHQFHLSYDYQQAPWHSLFLTHKQCHGDDNNVNVGYQYIWILSKFSKRTTMKIYASVAFFPSFPIFLTQFLLPFGQDSSLMKFIGLDDPNLKILARNISSKLWCLYSFYIKKFSLAISIIIG